MTNGSDHLRVVEAPQAPVDPLIGKTIDGRYEVERVLGQGGMGMVYQARHVVLNKRLAVKVLKPEVSQNEEIMARFRQEAQSATSIGSQHIIDISDFGNLPDNSTYFVMEFLEGRDLTQAIKEEQPMAPEKVVHIGRQLCVALGAAHEAGIVHRDLKPDNVFLIERGGDRDFVKVLDFGIAKVGGASSKLTKAGQVFGTPHYMSPEQCSGTAVDSRTDIYAIGIMLYEMSSGRVPFDADNLMGILTKHMYEKPVPLRDFPPPVNVPSSLEAIILKCLAKSADERYQSMAEVKIDLEALVEGSTPQAVMDAMERSHNSSSFATISQHGTPGIAIDYGPGPGTETSRSKMGLIVGALIGLLVLAGLGVAGVVAFMPTDDTVAENDAPPPVNEPPPETTAETTTTEVPETANTNEGVDATETTDMNVVLAEPDPVFVTIASTPEGAEVYVTTNGTEAFVGNTPYRQTRPAAGDPPVTLELRREGHQPRSIAVTSSTDDSQDFMVTLERTRRRRRQNASPQPQPVPVQQPAQPARPRTSSDVIDPWN